jgi:hypothetical protein
MAYRLMDGLNPQAASDALQTTKMTTTNLFGG